jgi:succinyl-diaminopimelate desuccinylase
VSLSPPAGEPADWGADADGELIDLVAGELAGEVVALASELIQIDTVNPPGAELPAAERMAGYLEAAGLEVDLRPFGEGRANLVARLPGRGERPSLLFSGHLDTVPVANAAGWTVPPWGGTVQGGRLYGRGSLDMKAGVAAMAVALKRLRATGQVPAGDLVLALTAGEETDSIGARMLCEAGLLGDVGMAIIAEPTNLDVGIAHRGALWVRVDAEGSSAHGSQPAAGVNAVRELLSWLDPMTTLEALIAEPVDPVLGSGSVSLNIIGGGRSVNVVPDEAHAVLDFRTVPGQSHGRLLDALRQRGGPIELTVLRDSPPITADADHPLVRATVQAVDEVTGGRPTRGLPYMTDGSIFVEALGITAVVVGPGTEADAHTDDESVEIRALGQAASIYESVAIRLMYEEAPFISQEGASA